MNLSKEELAEITGGLSIPGNFKFPFNLPTLSGDIPGGGKKIIIGGSDSGSDATQSDDDDNPG